MHATTVLARLALALSSTFAAGTLCAQENGAIAPEIEWGKTYNFDGMPTKKLSELRGSVVWLEFFATYGGDHPYHVKRCNDLHAKYAARGLAVVTITNEPAKDVDQHVEKYAPKHPVANGPYPGYNLRLVPYTFLVDKEGKVAWQGRPSEFAEAKLEDLLSGARPPTVRAGLEEVHRMRVGGQHGEAYTLAGKLLAEGTLSPDAMAQAKQWNAEAEKFVADAMAAADEAEQQKDVYGVFAKLDPVVRIYKGVPGGELAAERLAALTASKPNQQEIEAGTRFDEAQRMEAAQDYDGAIGIYDELGRRLGRTKAGKAAKVRQRDLLKGGMLGFRADCNYCTAGKKACPTHARKK